MIEVQVFSLLGRFVNERTKEKRKIPTMPAMHDSGSHIRALGTRECTPANRTSSLVLEFEKIVVQGFHSRDIGSNRK